MSFIDFEKAYDSMRREMLHNIHTEFGISLKPVRLSKCAYMKPVVRFT
jgi:hypothetical protein